MVGIGGKRRACARIVRERRSVVAMPAFGLFLGRLPPMLVAAPGWAAVKFGNQVGPADSAQAFLYVLALLGLVPEEILPLRQFFPLGLCREHRLQRVGVEPCVPGLGGNGHWRWGEVLHLLQMEVQLFGLYGQLCHVFLVAAGVGGYEVGYNLLVEMLLPVYSVEDALKLVELLEGGLAHEPQHLVTGVFRCYLQAAADMARDEFANVVVCGLVGSFVFAPVQQQVVSDAAADEALLDARQAVDSPVYLEQPAVVSVKVGAYLRVNAAGAAALRAKALVAALHAVHVGRRAAEVAQIALKVWQLADFPDLPDYAFLGTAADELSLMGRDGAEGTAAEASAVNVDRVLNHVVGGNALALVLGVWQSGVWQVE